MKKILILLTLLMIITGCQESDSDSSLLYEEMVDVLNNTKEFSSNSKFFSISFEKISTNDGNKFYIVIDNPTVAMFNVSILAFEKGLYKDNAFVANAGIFGNKINLVPNQFNKDNGFAKGISISGQLYNDILPVCCVVQWEDEYDSKMYREFFEFQQ